MVSSEPINYRTHVRHIWKQYFWFNRGYRLVRQSIVANSASKSAVIRHISSVNALILQPTILSLPFSDWKREQNSRRHSNVSRTRRRNALARLYQTRVVMDNLRKR